MNTRLIKIVNLYKTRFLSLFTSNFKNSNNLIELSKIDKQNVKRILVTRPNHRLGNQLLISPLIQVIESEFPNSKIDLLVNGNLSKILYKNYSNVEHIFDLPKKPFKNLIKYIKVSLKVISIKYDLAIAGIESSNSSKIFVKLSRAKFKIFDSGNKNESPKHIAKKPIYNLLKYVSHEKQSKHYPKLEIKLAEKEILNGKNILSNLFANKLITISIFTNATGNKKNSKKWWEGFCKKLKLKFPNINILEILPKENISQLDFAYTTYLSNDLREIASVIENCSIFIGADSGVMHLATATYTPTLGLFNGTTNPETYGPYGNSKYVIDIRKTSFDEIIEKIENTFYNNGY